jgi:hypothetical protein
LEENNGILIAKPLEGKDPSRPLHAEELLLEYVYNRGFMTANGSAYVYNRISRELLVKFSKILSKEKLFFAARHF